MTRADAFHERDAVETARDEAPRGHGHCDAAEQHAHEGSEHEKLLRSPYRRPHFGPSVAIVLEVLLRVEQRLELAAKAPQRNLVTREQQRVLRQTAGPHKS